jgi:hypothetical protein
LALFERGVKDRYEVNLVIFTFAKIGTTYLAIALVLYLFAVSQTPVALVAVSILAADFWGCFGALLNFLIAARDESGNEEQKNEVDWMNETHSQPHHFQNLPINAVTISIQHLRKTRFGYRMLMRDWG